MKTFAAVIILALGLGLGACGKKGELEPPERDSLTVIGQTATRG